MDENTMRAIKALSTMNTGTAAALRALEKVVLALAVQSQNKKEVIELTELFYKHDPSSAATTDPIAAEFRRAYEHHTKRLLKDLAEVEAFR